MQVWYLCENPYAFIPQDVLDSVVSVRASLPNRYCDPQVVMEFYDKVGGFEHLILMGRSGFMTHQDAEKGMRMFGREILPRLKEVKHTSLQ